MPPCLDVYVWINRERRRSALERFIERHVSTEEPGDTRFVAFENVYVYENGTDADHEALADLRRDDSAGDAFSLYVHARD